MQKIGNRIINIVSIHNCILYVNRFKADISLDEKNKLK